MTMTQEHKAGWAQLQRLSCTHALALHSKPFRNRKQIGVPEVIRENVEILGRGTEEQVKARILWYLEFHPAMFDRVTP